MRTSKKFRKIWQEKFTDLWIFYYEKWK